MYKLTTTLYISKYDYSIDDTKWDETYFLYKRKGSKAKVFPITEDNRENYYLPDFEDADIVIEFSDGQWLLYYSDQLLDWFEEVK